MENCEIKELVNTVKEFRYSIGYYHGNDTYIHAVAWHECTDKFFFILQNEFKYSGDGLSTCPNCGKPVQRWEKMRYHNHSCDNHDEIGDRREYLSFTNPDRIKISTAGDKISIGAFRTDYTLWSGENGFKKTVRYTRITINISSGYTYQFATKNLYRKNCFDNNKRLANICYFGTEVDLPDHALCHLASVISIQMKRIHGESVPTFGSYRVSLSLNNLILYVRNPYICPVLYETIINHSRSDPFNPLKFRELRVKNDCRDPIQKMFSQSKIPNVKSLRKIAFTESSGLPLLASISRTFQNVDIIRLLYDLDSKHEWQKLHDVFGTNVDYSARIFKEMVKQKGEKYVASKIKQLMKNDERGNTAKETLRDLTVLFDKLQNRNFDFTKSHDLYELHMHLADLVSRQENENRKIRYKDNDFLLEFHDETYSLSLAKDTHELIDVGDKMDICVGSYANDDIRKKSKILFLRYLESNEPIGCIEIRDRNIVQAKGASNELLEKQEREFVKAWVKNKVLTIATNDLSA